MRSAAGAAHPAPFLVVLVLDVPSGRVVAREPRGVRPGRGRLEHAGHPPVLVERALQPPSVGVVGGERFRVGPDRIGHIIAKGARPEDAQAALERARQGIRIVIE